MEKSDPRQDYMKGKEAYERQIAQSRQTAVPSSVKFVKIHNYTKYPIYVSMIYTETRQGQYRRMRGGTGPRGFSVLILPGESGLIQLLEPRTNLDRDVVILILGRCLLGNELENYLKFMNGTLEMRKIFPRDGMCTAHRNVGSLIKDLRVGIDTKNKKVDTYLSAETARLIGGVTLPTPADIEKVKINKAALGPLVRILEQMENSDDYSEDLVKQAITANNNIVKQSYS